MSTRSSSAAGSNCPLDIELRRFFEEHQICSSHGYDHANAVATHASKVMDDISSQVEMPPIKYSQVFVASLLHDLDDPKYFPTHKESNRHITVDGKSTVPNPNYSHANALKIIKSSTAYGSCMSYVDNIEKMIDLVSFSKNGVGSATHGGTSDSTAGDVEIDPLMLIPRYCDRLEAIGKIGIRRCLQVSKSFGNPLYEPGDEKIGINADIKGDSKTVTSDLSSSSTATCTTTSPPSTPARRSTSFIGHFRDKLLKIANPPPLQFRTKSGELIESKYLTEQFRIRRQELEEFVDQFTDLCKKINGGREDWASAPITDKNRILIETFSWGWDTLPLAPTPASLKRSDGTSA